MEGNQISLFKIDPIVKYQMAPIYLDKDIIVILRVIIAVLIAIIVIHLNRLA